MIKLETEYCDFCKKDKPKDGFDTACIFWGSYDNPPEYGNRCRDCQILEEKLEAEFASEQEEISL